MLLIYLVFISLVAGPFSHVELGQRKRYPRTQCAATAVNKLSKWPKAPGKQHTELVCGNAICCR